MKLKQAKTKKPKFDFSEASDENQQVQNFKKRRQDKHIKRCKSVAEFGKKHCQLKTTHGTNVKLLVASLGFVNRVYPKNTKLVKSFFTKKNAADLFLTMKQFKLN